MESYWLPQLDCLLDAVYVMLDEEQQSRERPRKRQKSTECRIEALAGNLK